MTLMILYILLPTFLFVVTLIEAIKEAVAGRKYWPWAVAASVFLASLISMVVLIWR